MEYTVTRMLYAAFWVRTVHVCASVLACILFASSTIPLLSLLAKISLLSQEIPSTFAATKSSFPLIALKVNGVGEFTSRISYSQFIFVSISVSITFTAQSALTVTPLSAVYEAVTVAVPAFTAFTVPF